MFFSQFDLNKYQVASVKATVSSPMSKMERDDDSIYIRAIVLIYRSMHCGSC